MRTLSLLFLLPACVARHSGEVVQGIRFDVEGRRFPSSLWLPQTDAALRGVLDQRTSSVLSLLAPGATEPEWLDPTRQEGDAKRVEVWFAEHGYFDAHFVGRDRKKGWFPFWAKKMRPTFLVGHVTQEAPSKVRSVTLAGAGLLEPRLRRAMTVVEDRVFSSTEYTATLGALRNTLLAAGYAFSDVTGSADAWPDQHVVDVRFEPRGKWAPPPSLDRSRGAGQGRGATSPFGSRAAAFGSETPGSSGRPSTRSAPWMAWR